MAKCIECGNALTKTVGDHVYIESGLDNVLLHNITKLSCESCGARSVEIPQMAKLHRLIASAIARKPARLEPDEVRFLRDHLELSNAEFAALMGVSASQASRWTSSEPIGVPAERFLRLLAEIGPEVLKGDSDEPIADQMKSAHEKVHGVAQVIHQLPPPSVEAKKVRIGLRRSSSGWRTEATN